MILRGIAAPSIFSQTIRYSKVSLDLAKKKVPCMVRKIALVCHWLYVRIILGAIRVI